MKDICVDTGFFFGLYQERHELHSKAKEYFASLFDAGGNRLVIPWPIVYETFVTNAVRNTAAMTVFKSDWKRLLQRGQLRLLSDLPFRQRVVEECFDELAVPIANRRNLSAADRVVRRVLADRNIRISAFITSNPKDFEDVCKRFRRTLLALAPHT